MNFFTKIKFIVLNYNLVTKTKIGTKILAINNTSKNLGFLIDSK